MPSSRVNKFVLSLVLCLSPISARCSGQWITVALADLPVLTQMAPNIATLVTTLHSGKELSATEAAAIQNISAEANKDLVLLQQLCHEYKASPSVDGIQNIQNVIADLNKNLSALLQAAHVKDPALSMRVNVAVNLILTTVNTFAALIPENSVNAPMQRSAGQQIALAQPKDPETAVEPASVLNERQSGARLGSKCVPGTLAVSLSPEHDWQGTKNCPKTKTPQTPVRVLGRSRTALPQNCSNTG